RVRGWERGARPAGLLRGSGAVHRIGTGGRECRAESVLHGGGPGGAGGVAGAGQAQRPAVESGDGAVPGAQPDAGRKGRDGDRAAAAGGGGARGARWRIRGVEAIQGRTADGEDLDARKTRLTGTY